VLPQSYQLPAVILLLLSGALTCFAGYRLFRVVLAIYGFILGAMLASSMMGISNTAGMILAAVVGGIVGSLILVFAYFVGIALVGAGLGALIAHVGWSVVRPGDPPAAAIIALAIVGAVAAMVLQRYVIIVSTAFGGAWTILVASLALVGDRAARHAVSTGEVWILYPMTPAPGDRWVPVVWIVLGLVGTAVQLGVTGRRR
jgi:hypothetical protein